jgi:hypothetical protein
MLKEMHRLLKRNASFLCVSHGSVVTRSHHFSGHGIGWICRAVPVQGAEDITCFACTKLDETVLRADEVQAAPSVPSPKIPGPEFVHTSTRSGRTWQPGNAILFTPSPFENAGERQRRRDAARQAALERFAAGDDLFSANRPAYADVLSIMPFRDRKPPPLPLRENDI